jgi:hypothetical protein
MTDTLMPIETPSVHMISATLVEVQVPPEDVERVMAAVTAIDPLAMSPRYDRNAWQSAPGIERYRPRIGAVAGAEQEVRLRPGVVRLIFETVGDAAHLSAIVEAVFQVHSYQEPVIRLSPCLTCRSKGLDDSANPHRWWNTTGDWKTQA